MENKEHMEKNIKALIINQQTIIAEIISENNEMVLLNPLVMFNVSETSLGFAPMLYTDPKEMKCVFRATEYIEYTPDKNLIESYMAYITKLTSSIIQLSSPGKLQQLNG